MLSVEAASLAKKDDDYHREVSEELAGLLRGMLKEHGLETEKMGRPVRTLVVGLGNPEATPDALGHTEKDRVANLSNCLDGYTAAGGFHVNVNVFNRDMLVDAMNHPELYPQLTVRVSGYAVNFIKLTRDQQLDVISRTFHAHI